MNKTKLPACRELTTDMRDLTRGTSNPIAAATLQNKYPLGYILYVRRQQKCRFNSTDESGSNAT